MTFWKRCSCSSPELETKARVLVISGWYLAWSAVKKRRIFLEFNRRWREHFGSSEARMLHQTGWLSLAVLPYGPGLFQAGPHGRTDWLGFRAVSNRSLWCMSMQLFSHSKQWVLTFLNYVHSAENSSNYGSRCRGNATCECPLYLDPLQQGLRVMELFVLKTEIPSTCAPFGVTLMSLRCQGL